MGGFSMAFTLTFLGTGDSAQVPVYNCLCAACERAQMDPTFKRRPCSALLQIADQQWLIDSGRMDLVERFPAPSLDGILQTHYHADHAQGLLHLRWGVNIRIPVWGPEDPWALQIYINIPVFWIFRRRGKPLKVALLPM